MGIPVDDLSHLGDPGGMEALASELLLRAESIAGIADSLSREVSALTFEGPAAAALQQSSDDRRRRAERVAGQLRDAAYSLRGRAADARDLTRQVELERRREEDR